MNKRLISLDSAFSLIEIVFVLMLSAIFLMVLLPKLEFQTSLCSHKLANQLTIIQQELSFLYTKSALSQSLNTSIVLNSIASKSLLNDNKCFLGFENGALVAKNHNEKIVFTLIPNDLSINPSIQCDFRNRLCRSILNRKQAK